MWLYDSSPQISPLAQSNMLAIKLQRDQGSPFDLRSSTETELVAVDAYMPEMLWSLYFIQGQGYSVEFVELHQDNISAQMLEVNRRFSSSKKTKHIKAKFFFIKDKVDLG